MTKKKKIEYDAKCLLLTNVFTAWEIGLFHLNGMCWLLEKKQVYRKTCEKCSFFRDIPPKSYTCQMFYCSLDKAEIE